MEVKAIHFDPLTIDGEWCDCATAFIEPESVPELIAALRKKGHKRYVQPCRKN